MAVCRNLREGDLMHINRRRSPAGAALAAGLVVLALAAAGRGAEREPARGAAVGIKDVPGAGIGGDAQMAADLGLNLFHTTRRWVEPRAGDYAWAENAAEDTFAVHLAQLKEAGYAVSLTLDTVDDARKRLPSDLEDRRLDDAALLARWEAFVKAMLGRYGACIDYLNIGNNVDEYFEKHGDEWPGFVRMVQLASSAAAKGHPKLSVGVVLREEGRVRFWGPLKPFCGHLGVKYFAPFTLLAKRPAAWALDPRRPEFFAKTLDAALKLAAPRKVLLVEVGCPTHEALDASPAVQAQFITALMGWLRSREAGVAGLAWATASDWPYDATRKALTGVLDESVPGHKAYLRFLTTLGLKTEDGQPKPGYMAMRTAIENYRKGR